MARPFSAVISKYPPETPFETSEHFKITSRGYFYFVRLIFAWGMFGQILDKFGVQGVFECCEGSEGSQVLGCEVMGP